MKSTVCHLSPCCFRGQRWEVSLSPAKPALEVSASSGLLALPAPLPLKRAGQSGLLHSRGQDTQVHKPWALAWLAHKALSVHARDGHRVLPAYPADWGLWPWGRRVVGGSHCLDQLWGLSQSGSTKKQSAHLRLLQSRAHTWSLQNMSWFSALSTSTLYVCIHSSNIGSCIASLLCHAQGGVLRKPVN